ncbi:MAG: TonB-dependent receptor [Lewinellaceae bacterium]|nr:TonB-dependent receptor [Lewinellaceae bacterium]
MKRIILCCLFLGATKIAFAQVVNIKDQQSGQPVEAASIVSASPRELTTTNAKGQADISVFKGAEIIEIRALGYETAQTSYAALETTKFEFLLLESTLNFDEVIVSATRWNQAAKDIPTKVISISPKDIALQNPQTAADMLANSGYVFMQKSQQGGGSPMIRGFATNRLIYTIDGVRMNTAIFRGGNIQNVISLDPFATEKAEVGFGPSSVIYGSDAIGGVMSFQTLTPQLSLNNSTLITGKAVTRYSSANQEKTGHFDINVGWKKWAMVSSISSNNFGDLKMGSDGPKEYLRPFYVQRQGDADVVVGNDDPRIQRPSGYSQINMMQKLRYTPNEKWDFQYGFHHSESSEYSRYDRHIRYRSNGQPRYGEWAYGPQKWNMNNLNISHNGSNGLYDQATLRAARQFFEESRIDRNINDNERHIRIEEVIANSVNLDFNKSIGSKNRLFYGAEFVHNDVNSTGIDEDISTGVTANGPARYPKSTWASFGAYLSDQFLVSDKFTVQAGMRYSQFSLDATFDTTFYKFPFVEASLNNGALTGSLGFVFRPTKEWVISANGATAFRSPNVDDIGKVFDSEPGAVVIPNPDLKAEYAFSGDVGIAKVFGGFLKIDLTGYYTNLQNAMVRRDFTLNGQDSIDYDGSLSQVQAIQNAAVATVYGIQAGIEAKFGKGFGFSTDFNYQNGKEELDNGTTSPSRHAAPWFGISRLTYAAENLSLQFSAEYSGEKTFADMPTEEKGKPEIYAFDPDGNPYSPGWYSLNFNAMYRFTDHLSVSAGIENLSDQRYRPFSSGIVAPGRNFILSLRANF